MLPRIVARLSRLGAIYVTNAAGDNIHVIDPATNKVVQEIKGVEAAHGIALAPDGSRVYVSNEADSTLDVYDRESGELVKKVPLSNHPNNIAVTKNGDRVLVGIARGPGAVDVIDAKTLTLTKSILVKGRLHNIYVTPDGKHLITGSIPAKLMTVIDLETETPVWELQFDLGVRPMTIEAGPDGCDQAHLRADLRHQRLRGGGFRGAQGGGEDHVAEDEDRIRDRRRARHLALARHRRHARQQDALGHQHSQQCGVRLFARRPQAHRRGRAAEPQAARPRPDLLGAELGDVHARQQDHLHLERRASSR